MHNLFINLFCKIWDNEGYGAIVTYPNVIALSGCLGRTGVKLGTPSTTANVPSLSKIQHDQYVVNEILHHK